MIAFSLSRSVFRLLVFSSSPSLFSTMPMRLVSCVISVFNCEIRLAFFLSPRKASSSSFALFSESRLSYVSRRPITSLYSARRLRSHSVCAELSAVEVRISRSDGPRLRYAAYFFSSRTSCSSSLADLSWKRAPSTLFTASLRDCSSPLLYSIVFTPA